jgi:hypothetical protein
MQQLWDHGGFHPDFKGTLEKLGNVRGSGSLQASLRGLTLLGGGEKEVGPCWRK